MTIHFPTRQVIHIVKKKIRDGLNKAVLKSYSPNQVQKSLDHRFGKRGKVLYPCYPQ